MMTQVDVTLIGAAVSCMCDTEVCIMLTPVTKLVNSHHLHNTVTTQNIQQDISLVVLLFKKAEGEDDATTSRCLLLHSSLLLAC